ncbi:MAG: UDP-N-acetylmuramate dehydrogenase [Candidatus Pacebacteria bacterium]|nr:UDP-N-acetylmuramate dehydrogenase [Candidatus Paceibacterota bacterium]
MKILEKFDLTKFNTFGIKAIAKYFVEINSLEDLLSLSQENIFKENPKLFLGGGSNILFTQDFEGLVILNKLKGIETLSEEDNTVFVKSFGGEVWNDLVLFTVEKGYFGLENLALIPGSVGASPVQNIGAYGVELKDSFFSLTAFDIENGIFKDFHKDECEFGYRDSIFKNKYKGKYFIVAVTFRLNKKGELNQDYKVLKNYISENNLNILEPKDISEAVSNIRRSKLPDPKVLGNAGSFFKNSYINEEKLVELLKTYPDIPYFKEEDKIKVPTAWLIETLGFKGKAFGKVGVHDKQALILVNYGGAEGKDIKNLAYEIIKAVKDKFDIEIAPEVNII